MLCFQRHELASLCEKILAVGDVILEQRERQAMGSQVSLERSEAGDAAVLHLAANTLRRQLGEVLLGGLVADGDVT